MNDFFYKYKKNFDRIILAIEKRKKPVVVFVQTLTFSDKLAISDIIAQQTPEYKHIKIDLRDKNNITSIDKVLAEYHNEIFKNQKIEHVIHIFGLGNHFISFDEQAQIKPSDFLKDFNLTRERIFRQIPAILIFYLDKPSIRYLHKFAPDFWDWVNYLFEFDDVVSYDQNTLSKQKQDDLSSLSPQQQKDFEKKVSELEEARKSLEDEKLRIRKEDEEKQLEIEKNRDRIWAEHEVKAISKMKEICIKPEYSFNFFENTNLPESFD